MVGDGGRRRQQAKLASPAQCVTIASDMETPVMTPTDAARRQIDRYRQMTGEQRLKIALDLHEVSCQVAREGIRSQFPNATDEMIEERLRERIRLGYRLRSREGA